MAKKHKQYSKHATVETAVASMPGRARSDLRRAAALAPAPSTAPPAPGAPYLDHPARVALIFGSFFLLCVPLALSFFTTPSNTSAIDWLLVLQVYSVAIGYTHFAITFSIYLDSRNLEFFRSTPKNILVYFVVPILILLVWFLIGVSGINRPAPHSSAAFLLYLFWFALLTKLADYLHVVRQSFGVLQLFKRHVPVAFPRWMRRTENAFFIVLMGLQVLTFSEGLKADDISLARFNTHNPFSVLGLALAAVLFLAILCGYVLMARTVTADRRRLLVPLSYFLLQTASASLPVYWSAFYLASLAMHYVEYHVIMYPRVFKSTLASHGGVDRVRMWLRSHKVVFYGALVGFAYLFMGDGFAHLGMVLPISKGAVWFLLNLFNGIFMAHFFVEAFVWKFGVPFYRQALTPLYFPAVKAPA